MANLDDVYRLNDILGRINKILLAAAPLDDVRGSEPLEQSGGSNWPTANR